MNLIILKKVDFNIYLKINYKKIIYNKNKVFNTSK